MINTRYNIFIKLRYFTITPFIYDIKHRNLVVLNGLNDLIIKLYENKKEKDYYDIIIFLQKNKFDLNNTKIVQIIKESEKNKKE